MRHIPLLTRLFMGAALFTLMIALPIQRAVLAEDPPGVSVIGRTADLYTSPSLEARIMVRVDGGTQLATNGPSADGLWWQVIMQPSQAVGWVRNSLVEPNPAAQRLAPINTGSTGPTPAPIPTSVATSVATSAAVMGTATSVPVPTNTAVPATATPVPATSTSVPPTSIPTKTNTPLPTYTPTRTPTPSRTPTNTPTSTPGFARSASEPAVSVIVAESQMRLMPNNQAASAGVVKKGNVVPTQGQSTDAKWWRILNPFNTIQQAWLAGNTVKPNARAQYLARLGSRVTTLRAAKLWVSPNPSSAVVTTSRAGISFIVVRRTADNQWYRVAYGKSYAWMNASDTFVTAQDQRVPVVKIVQ